MKLSKQQFKDRLTTILSLSKSRAANLEKQRHIIEEQCKLLAAHDPNLAHLVAEADMASLRILNELIRYIGSRVEN